MAGTADEPPGRGAGATVTRALALAGVPLAVLAAALLAGGAAGYLLLRLLLMSTSADEGLAAEGLDALGAALAAMAVGVLVAALTYPTGLVVAAWRLFARGRRAVPVLVSLAGCLALAGFAAVLTRLQLTPAADRVSQALLTVAGAGCASAVFLAFGGAGRVRFAGLALVAAVVLAAGLVAGTSAVVHARHEAQVAAELPLVLFDGKTADPAGSDGAVFAGWRRDAFSRMHVVRSASFTDQGVEGYLKYFTPKGVTFVTMHTDAGSCSTPAAGYTCEPAGRLPGGQLRLYTRSASYGSYPHADAFLVLVHPDGSAVSVDVVAPLRPSTAFGGSGLDVAQARDVLAALRPVDQERFESVSGERITLL